MMVADRVFEILLVEDSPGDVDLLRECLAECARPHHLNVVEDGEAALAFLQRKDPYGAAVRPDLILLDLNLPRKDGRQVLAALKADDDLKRIPVVILTTSRATEDVRRCYDLHANCYLSKPISYDGFARVVKTIEEFWFTLVILPPGD